jgi:hypothetical protein
LRTCIVTANAWEEGDEVVLITCRLENPDLDKVNGHQSDKLENFGNELYVPAISIYILYGVMQSLPFS